MIIDFYSTPVAKPIQKSAIRDGSCPAIHDTISTLFIIIPHLILTAQLYLPCIRRHLHASCQKGLRPFSFNLPVEGTLGSDHPKFQDVFTHQEWDSTIDLDHSKDSGDMGSNVAQDI